MNTRNRIRTLTVDNKNTLLSKTFYVLPDNPSDKNFSPSQIRKKGYEGYLVLFTFINDIIDQINANVDLTNTDLTAVNTAIETLNSNFSSGKANQAIADGNNNNIASTYATKAENAEKVDKRITSGLYAYVHVGNTQNELPIATSATGDTIAKRESDGRLKVTAPSNDSDATTKKYVDDGLATKVSKTDGTNKVYSTNNNGEQATIGVDYGSNFGGNIARRDSNSQIYVPLTPTANGHASSKSYADSLVARANLISIIGEATQSASGLLSATDKARLDTLYALLGTGDDDTVVDTIGEILAIFDQYPEGADLVTALAGKVGFTDIIDDLTTNNSGKPVSAKQAYILKGLIDGLSSSKANASDVYAKADTYSTSQADDKFRTQAQVDSQIDTKLAGVSNMNVIADVDNDKNYNWQIKIQGGKAHLIAEEVE